MSIQKFLSGFVRTNSWENISRKWQLGFIEDQPYIPGQQPSDSMQNILETNATHISILDKKNTSTQITVSNSLDIMIKESIYLLHKAGSILRSYNGDIERHDQTYAEISAYTASFFLARGINLLLGCFLSTTNISRKYIISNIRGTQDISELALSLLPNKPGHYHVWFLFKELIVNTTDLPFDREIFSFIHQIDAKEFPEIRNQIQYNNCEWIYDDLHLTDHASKEWIIPFDKKIYLYCNSQDPSCHFSTIVSLILFRAMYLLIKDLCEKIPCLEDEKKLVESNMEFCNSTLLTNSWI